MHDEGNSGVEQTTTTPVTSTNGWFRGLPTWGQVLFMLVYPVSLPYGIWAVWKKGGNLSQLPAWAKWLFIIMYPFSVPYGIFVMWRDKRYSQGMRVAATAAAAAFFIFGFAAAGSDSGINSAPPAPEEQVAVATPKPMPSTTPTPSVAATPTTAPTPTPAPPAPKPKPAPEPPSPTREQQLTALVTDAVGSDTNNDKPKVRSITESGGDAYWLVSLNGDDNFTNNMIKEGMWLDSKSIWKEVFSSSNGINELIIRWYFPLTDVKGNTKDEKVMELVMTRKNASDVNWGNVLTDNIPLIADDYWESRVFDN